MAPDSDGPDDATALRERVRQLEATVSDQQETIEKMLPSRRQAIAGGALLGGGLLGGAGASRRASAQSAAGQVGTSSEPVDVFGYDLDVAGQVTSNVDLGSNDLSAGAIDANTVNAASFADGVAGDGNTITSVADNEGEYRIISANSFGQGELSTTSTSFVEPMDLSDVMIRPFNVAAQNTNIEDNLYFALAGEHRGDEGTARVAGCPDSEVTGSSFNRFCSGFDDGSQMASFIGNTNILRIEIKVSTDGDEYKIGSPTVIIAERIA